MEKEPILFKTKGNLWNYEKIAAVSARIADEFLKRLELPFSERRRTLLYFIEKILDTSNGVNRIVEIPLHESLFEIAFEEDMGLYKFNENGEIVDYEGVVVPQDFELDNLVYLRFHQHPRLDPFTEGTSVVEMQGESVMQFIDEVCKKYEGLSPLYKFKDVPPVLRRHGTISGIEFDKNVYGEGRGDIIIKLRKYVDVKE